MPSQKSEKGTERSSRLGQEIRRLRLESGLTPKEFADELGKTQSIILLLEQGELDIDVLTLEKCAQIFQIEMSTLLKDSDNHAAVDI